MALFESLSDSGVPHIRQVCCGLRFLFAYPLNSYNTSNASNASNTHKTPTKPRKKFDLVMVVAIVILVAALAAIAYGWYVSNLGVEDDDAAMDALRITPEQTINE